LSSRSIFRKGVFHYAPTNRVQPRRPWTRWGFGLIVALLGLYNVLLALDNFFQASVYRDLGVSYPSVLRAALALSWGVPLLALGIGVLWRQDWTRRWWLILLSNYGAFNVLWLLVFAESDFSRGRVAFQAVVTVALLGLSAVILRWRRVFAFGDDA
jgi:hypothetical protein